MEKTPAEFVLVPQAGMEIGLGHLRRMLALGEAASLLGHRVLFATKYVEGALVNEIEGKFETTSLDSAQGQNLDSRFVVLDGYQIPIEKYRAHKDLVVFEDFVHREISCGFLVDANLGSDSLSSYDSYSYKNLLEGERFISLATEYRKPAKIRDFVSKPRLLVTLGGSDPYNFTDLVLEKIRGQFENFSTVSVAIGPLNLNEADLRRKYSDYEINWIRSPESLFDVYENHDVAIGAGGTSAYERVNRNLPSINLVTADNQFRVSEGLARAGLAYSVDLTLGRKPDVIDISHLINEASTRKARLEGNTFIDGYGSTRLILEILSKRVKK